MLLNLESSLKIAYCAQKLAQRGQDVPAQLRDPNNLIDLLPVAERTLERLRVH